MFHLSYNPCSVFRVIPVIPLFFTLVRHLLFFVPSYASPTGWCGICCNSLFVFSSSFVHIWDVETGTRRDVEDPVKHNSWVSSVSFSHDTNPSIASMIVSSGNDRSVRLWDGASGSSIGRPVIGQEYIWNVIFSPDGQFIVTGADDGTISLLDRRAVEQSNAQQQEEQPSLTKIAISRDGDYLFAVSNDTSIQRFSIQNKFDVRSIGSPMHGHTGTIHVLAISADGQLLASGSHDRTIRIWDAQTGDPVGGQLREHASSIRGVAFRNDGERLLSCSADDTIRVWNTTTWKIMAVLSGHTNTVYSTQFYADGEYIISGSHDSTIRIWNAESGQPIGNPLQLDSGIWAITMSPTKDLAAVGLFDGSILLINVKTLFKTQFIEHGTETVNSVVFTSDGKQLLSASDDHTICRWNVETGQLIGRRWEGHSSAVNKAFFLDNETCIVSAALDGVIRIWDLDLNSTNPASPADLQLSFPRINRDGWVHSDDGKLLFWLPPDYRSTFLWGRCQKLVGAEPLELDFSRFEHGDRWMRCYTPSESVGESESETSD